MGKAGAGVGGVLVGEGLAGAGAKETHEDLHPQEYRSHHCSMRCLHTGHTHTQVRFTLPPHCSHDFIVGLAGEVMKDYTGSIMVTFL